MTYEIRSNGPSRSFPAGDAFLDGASENGDIVVFLLGAPLVRDDGKAAILVELDLDCLGEHTGEEAGTEGSNVLGFARYRNGDDAPGALVELVRQPGSNQAAIDAARALFEGAGLTVALCSDQAGRIIDRLVRPKYNAALRFLDEGLASAEAMDLTCKMGLGYPDGPIERVERGGLARHYDITRGLFEVSGQPAYAPARRAAVAHARKGR